MFCISFLKTSKTSLYPVNRSPDPCERESERVCVCEREREGWREGEREGARKRERGTERQRAKGALFQYQQGGGWGGRGQWQHRRHVYTCKTCSCIHLIGLQQFAFMFESSHEQRPGEDAKYYLIYHESQSRVALQQLDSLHINHHFRVRDLGFGVWG